MSVDLTQEQVRGSPPIESDIPVSRQLETSYYDYYGLPYYWTCRKNLFVPARGMTLTDR